MQLRSLRAEMRSYLGGCPSHEETSVSVVEITFAALGPSEARRLTDEVKQDAQALWKKLLALYEGDAHTALGYESWGAYAAEEFGVGQSQAYRLLDAGRVAEAIE